MEQPTRHTAFDFVADFFESRLLSGVAGKPTLGEREFVEHAMRFANDDADANLGTLLSGVDTGLPADLSAETDPLLAGLVKPGEQMSHARALDRFDASLRAEFIQVLTKRLTSVIAAKSCDGFRALGDPSGKVLTVHQFGTAGKGLISVNHVMPVDFAAAFAFAAHLFVDTGRPYGGDLCRCRLESCQRFFFRRQDKSGGQPGKLYCSPGHMNDYHRARTAQRVRKYRERKAVAKTARKSK